MSRDLTTQMQAALEAENLRLVMFVQLDFGSGTVYLNSLDFPVEWDGHTWLGAGRVGRIAAIEESEAVQAYGVNLTLAGVDTSLLSIALGENYQGRAVRIWLGAFDDAYTIVSDPVLAYRGRMDNMRIVAGQEATITIACEGRLADLERARVRRYNQEDQQMVWPADKFFEFVPQMVAKELFWGLPTPAGAST